MDTKTNEKKQPSLDVRAQEADRMAKLAALGPGIRIGGEPPVDPEAAGRRIKSGTATAEDLKVMERAKAEGKRHEFGPSVSERNAAMRAEEQQQAEMLAADPRKQREQERAEKEKEFIARVHEADRRLNLQRLKLDTSTNKYRPFGAGTAPVAEARKHELRRDLDRDVEDAFRREGIAGAEATLDKYENEIVPAGLKEIDEAQSAYMLAISQARQTEERRKLELEVRRINPENALAVLEAGVRRLRTAMKDGEEIVEVAGEPLDERGSMILEAHFDVIFAALKRREEWKALPRRGN
jgi:hypothetical protein